VIEKLGARYPRISLPGDLREHLPGVNDILPKLTDILLVDQPVGVAVTRYLMARRRDFPDEFRLTFRDPPEAEEGGPRSRPGEHGKNALGVGYNPSFAIVPALPVDHPPKILYLKPVLNVDGHDRPRRGMRYSPAVACVVGIRAGSSGRGASGVPGHSTRLPRRRSSRASSRVGQVK
jgi:hypothetical protein